MIFLTTLGLIKHRRAFFISFIACLLAIILLNTFYVLFPAFYPRGDLGDHSSISFWLMEFTREIDGANNTFPSGHVTFSWLMVFTAANCELISKAKYKFIKHLYIIWALGISLSTLFLKQHFIIDVFSGALMALLCYNISRNFINHIVKKKSEQRVRFLFE